MSTDEIKPRLHITRDETKITYIARLKKAFEQESIFCTKAALKRDINPAQNYVVSLISRSLRTKLYNT